MARCNRTQALDRPDPPRPRAVLACSDARTQDELSDLVREKGLEPFRSVSFAQTQFLLSEPDTALVVCQATFSDGDFRDLLRAAAENGSGVPVVVCADFYEPGLYLEAMELGAFDYIVDPYHREGVEWVLANAIKEAVSIRTCHDSAKTAFAAAAC